MTQQENTGEMNLTELLSKVKALVFAWWKHRWLMIFFSLVGGVVAFLYAHFTKEISYTSRITFVIEGGAPTSGLSSLASQFGIGGGGGGAASSLFSSDNALLLLKSQRILEKALLKDYRNNPDSNLFNQYLARKFPDKTKAKEVHYISSTKNRETFTRPEDSTMMVVIQQLTSKIFVDRLDKKSNITEIRVEGADEQWVLDFSKVLLEEFANLQIQLKVGNIKASIKVLEHRLDSVQAAMRAAMYGVAQETDQSMGIIQAKPRVETGKKQMEAQLLSGLYAEIFKTLEMTRYSLDREQPVIEVIDHPRLPLQITGRERGKFAVLGVIIGFVLVTAFVFIKFIVEDILTFEKTGKNPIG